MLREHGWLPSPWYADMRARASDTGDPLAMSSACASVGLQGHASIVPVELPVTVEQLTGWRAGLPHTAGWLGSLGGVQRARVLNHLRAAFATETYALRVDMVVLDVRRAA